MRKVRRHERVPSRKLSAAKTKRRRVRQTTLEKKYIGVFQPNPLPYQGIFTGNESLEQPSPLKDYPSTATPGVGVSIELQPRRYAKLEPAIH
jgi:hypothetical protein